VTDLFWPGDDRAGSLMSGEALAAALVEVERAWLAVLVDAGIAPSDAGDEVADLVDPAGDLETLAVSAESGGNPVIPLVRLLRERLAERRPEAARWLHRGLTSQDVMDTALMLCVRSSVEQVLTDVRRQVTVLRTIADRHRSTLEPGRTLTQYAVPTTFGLTAATWLDGVVDAAEDLGRVRAELPVQVGGAAGTLAAVTELAGLAGSAGDPATTAVGLARALADRLDLCPAPSWHTSRRAVTRVGDALVACTDAWGHVANDVLVRARPEIAELSEAPVEGRGGSSTMPQKQNPVLSVLVRRAALNAPLLGAQLHTAAAAVVDQRPDGAWHAEWAPLRTLVRSSVVAASQTAELLEGLEVHADRMRSHVEGALTDLLAEQRAVRSLGESAPAEHVEGAAGYLGASRTLVTAALDRADRYLKETS
jgi:3-carboxy-cis,cis-muconate cycloisomerase